MLHAVGAARRGGLHDCTAPALDVAKTDAINLEHFFNDVKGGLHFAFSPRGYAQGVLPVFDICDGVNPGFFAHGENEPIPGRKHADSSQRNSPFVKPTTQIGHSAEAHRITETKIKLLAADKKRGPGSSEL